MPEKGKEVPGRRRLLRNIVAVGAMGVAGLLLQEKAGLIPEAEAAPVTGCASGCCTAIYGVSAKGYAGLFFQGQGSPGVKPALWAHTCNGNYLVAKFSNSSCLQSVDGSALIQLEANECNDKPAETWNLAVGGFNNGFGLTSGQFYLEHPIGSVRFLIDGSGNVGIGTSTPEAPLTVVSGSSITAALIGTSQGNLIFAKSGTNGFSMYSNAANYLGFYSNDLGLQPLTMNGSGVAVGNAYKSTAPPTNGAIIEGSVGIGTSAPTQTLSVQGTAGKSCGGSTWATFSDRRWKDPDSFRPFTEGLAWVRSLPPPMRFHYAEGNGIGADPAKEHVNFVAQCLLDGTHQNLVSEIQAKVKTNDKEPTTTYAVNVSDMQFAMLNAIKELESQNMELRERIAVLERKLAAS